ncbi:hypothetical protein [Streptomyces sp. NBC_01190]|uniref:hypothetical protein n=1 Tax=Streptomyces sp. NBC_01190 TaxID=2903767 RepID=UPI003865A54B|nr:hypothetical protein OG519_23010 [Streptomyces sp. NBC_01190]
MPTRSRRTAIAVGVAALGTPTLSVLEYDTDVPQFGSVWYLPVLLLSTLLAAAVIRTAVPARYPVTLIVVLYAATRVGDTLALDAMHRATTALPLAVLGLAVADLPWPTALTRYAGAAAGVGLTTWLAAATGVSTVTPGAVATVAVPCAVVLALALGAATFRPPTRTVTASVVLLAVAGLAIAVPQRASAHDPGQGPSVAPTYFSVVSDGQGNLSAMAVVEITDCAALRPQRLVARRGGSTLHAPLTPTGPCRYTGTIHTSTDGRWFVYLELHHAVKGDLEAWLPVKAEHAGRVTEVRHLYIPNGRRDGGPKPTKELVSGAALYALGISLLAFILIELRRVRPVTRRAAAAQSS